MPFKTPHSGLMANITYLNSTPDNAKLVMILKWKLGFGGTSSQLVHLSALQNTPFYCVLIDRLYFHKYDTETAR